MKALLLDAPGSLVMEETDAPVPGAGEVLIRVAACGICGSDVHGYDGSSGRRIPPLVMGHEAAGVVTACGTGATRFAVGERVTFDSTVYCGECFFCGRGEINLCDRREVVGVSCQEFRRNGAFAEFVVVPERIVHSLPESMAFADAAMLEAVAVALHAVHLTPMEPGATVLVIGAGMIGLLIAQSLAATGCTKILVADVDETRLKLARNLGVESAIQTLLASGEELVKAVRAATEGRGVDAVLEAVGRDETVIAAIDAVKKGGTVTLVGNITPTVTLPLQKVVSRQIRLQGSCASSGEYPEAITLVSEGKIRVKPLITAVAALEDGAKWFERLHGREPGLMKILLDPRISAQKISVQKETAE